MLESSGLQPSRRVQRLYAGESAGQPSYALTYSRFRAFGGTTTRWAAQCRPLDPMDFEARPGIAYSGWPFDHRHLEAWYARAMAVCGLGSDRADPWRPDAGALPLADPRLEVVGFRFGWPARLRPGLSPGAREGRNIRICLDANVVELEPTPDLRALQAIRAQTLDGRTLRIEAQAYVLACGGIENARLLLASNRAAPAGLGNLHDLVGRFFLDHPYITTGHFVPALPSTAAGPHVIRYKEAGLAQKSHAGFVLDPELRRREALPACSAYFIRCLASETAPEHFSPAGRARRRLIEFLEHRTLQGAEIGRHLRTVAKGWREVGPTLARRTAEMIRPQHVLAFRTILETTPRPDSRVTLTSARDRLGMPCCGSTGGSARATAAGSTACARRSARQSSARGWAC